MNWPRPRIGTRVHLKNGVSGEVISVRSAADVLRGKTEMDAMIMGPRMRALYGSQWMSVYYEADIILDGDEGEMKTVTTQDIERVEKS
jgi:hypothetical protein